MKPIPPEEQNCKGSILEKYYEFNTVNEASEALKKRIKSQHIDLKKESSDKPNLDNLILNSIHILAWAHRMKFILWYYQGELKAKPIEMHSMYLEFQYDMHRIFKQQYEDLKYYIEKLENKDIAVDCYRFLRVIESYYSDE